jgi:hypothetical protein
LVFHLVIDELVEQAARGSRALLTHYEALTMADGPL